MVLKSCRKPEDTSRDYKKAKVQPRKEEDKPAQTWNRDDAKYSGWAGRLLLATDSQSLAQIANGHIQYTGHDGETKETFRKTIDNLLELMEMGWGPRDNLYDLIMWRPREKNKSGPRRNETPGRTACNEIARGL